MLGLEKIISVNELADMISDNQVHIPPRKGESRITLADNTRLRNLGWQPKVTIDTWISEQMRTTEL